ncbi:hypothetical protein AKH15_07095 [Vibrio parahaemolyticus]|uniref:hypothetical protein n=1 Tax=Vibrio parahaemolyticus TaxID=670 RepID=UPI0008136B54|nr:hypothetical protein [Vibrio parahaemolyticus]OCQ02081.1 hypothetical protein AKH15_07095 [Vibrio parahaemolyticus]
MLDNMKDDAVSWMNFSPFPSKDEIQRMNLIIGDEGESKKLLDFGLRPLSVLDDYPDMHPSAPDKPFNVQESHFIEENMLVDIFTGCRFLFDQKAQKLKLNCSASNNALDATELLMKLSMKEGEQLAFKYATRNIITESTDSTATFPLPLEFNTKSDGSLADIIDKLNKCLLGKYGVKKLWFRGQRTEYRLNRNAEITDALYGKSCEPSLIPSLGRFVEKNPNSAGFKLSFTANHKWKKPFLIWMILENSHWFGSCSQYKQTLEELLTNEDDQLFSQLLLEIQMSPSMFGDESVSKGVEWPDEVDDLRQWFFAFMKRREFGITLQQYGYPSSLLDLTDSLDVALYFSQAKMIDGKFKVEPPGSGRVLYVFAERNTGDFFRHGSELFWGEEGWSQKLPPRLLNQNAGFMMGSNCRSRNFYEQMIVAKIWLDDPEDKTSLNSSKLFPYHDDLLFEVLDKSQPELSELY